MFHWLSRLITKPIKRSPARQDQVDKESDSLTLYIFPFCPYCTKVSRVIHKLNLNIEQRDAVNATAYANELRQGGGKMQTPCLRIQYQDKSEWLYESDDIILYLRQHFATAEDLTEDYYA
ncbi:MAG: glutathione S-transferase N-terminal domain-containing protein [Candidatus Thiodiazotropha sp. 6PLUC2]